MLSQLSSIPGLEDVTVDGLNQQHTAQTNGPSSASQNQTEGPATGAPPPSEVGSSLPKEQAETCRG